MIFEQEALAFQILDVFHLDQGNSKTFNCNRDFDALSFRYEAEDVVIEANKKQMELAKNAICYFPSGLDYSRTAKKDKVIVVHFRAFNYHAEEMECFYPADEQKYASLFRKILSIWNRKEPACKHDVSAVLNNIFSELYKDNLPEQHLHSKIYPSLRYIEKNFMKRDFSLKTAAEKSMVSDTYFRKLFKAELKTSPKKYVIACRMKHAASLMTAGYFSLLEVAEMCGYEDYKHFSVEFKKHMGVSPSGYGKV